MSKHAGCRDRVEALDKMQIAVTKTCISGTQQHLVRQRLCYLERFDGHGLVHFVKDGGPHGCSFPAELFSTNSPHTYHCWLNAGSVGSQAFGPEAWTLSRPRIG